MVGQARTCWRGCRKMRSSSRRRSGPAQRALGTAARSCLRRCGQGRGGGMAARVMPNQHCWPEQACCAGSSGPALRHTHRSPNKLAGVCQPPSPAAHQALTKTQPASKSNPQRQETVASRARRPGGQAMRQRGSEAARRGGPPASCLHLLVQGRWNQRRQLVAEQRTEAPYSPHSTHFCVCATPTSPSKLVRMKATAGGWGGWGGLESVNSSSKLRTSASESAWEQGSLAAEGARPQESPHPTLAAPW